MGSSSARAEVWPGLYGPANVWASLAWGIRAEGRPDVPGPAGGWVFKVIGSGGHRCWARALRYPQCPPFSTGEVNRPRLEKE